MEFIANFARGDYISKMPEISDRYNVNLDEDLTIQEYIHKTLYHQTDH